MERVIAVLGCLITGLRIYCVSQKSQPVTSFHPPFPHELVFDEDLMRPSYMLNGLQF